MVKSKHHLKQTTESNKKGEIKLILSDLADFDSRNEKLELFSLAQLKPGEEVDYHIHEGECEYYYIISGRGEYNDNGNIFPVNAGLVTYTPSGSSHGIKNTGDGILEFVALIIKD